MRLRITTVFVFLLICSFQLAAVAAAPPAVSAEACYLIVADSGRPLFGLNEDKIMYPASTTKIMTLLVALEKGDLDSVVTVSRRAAACDGSSLDLQAGNQLTLQNLLTGMMAVSGNDAAEAVAEHIGGSIPGFVALMNQKAQSLHLNNTHFTNPHGLPDPVGHYTTAHDLATIAAYALKQPGFGQYVSRPNPVVTFLRPNLSRRVHNTNRLLSSYPGANGVKTGSTNDAGDCLVASATRNGVQLVAVVLNDDERWQDAASLLDYGFAQLQAGK